MKPLKESFRKNGLLYTLIKRNEKVALFGVGGCYTDEFIHFEVCKIHIRDNEYGHREAIPSNEQFGIDGSSAFNNLPKALNYFGRLTETLNSKVKTTK